MNLRNIILLLFLYIITSCKQKKNGVFNKYSNSIAKTTGGDSVSIIGEWRLTCNQNNRGALYANQGQLVNFKFNNMLEISPNEYCIWALNNNILKLQYPKSNQIKLFVEDSLYVMITKQKGYFEMNLTEIKSKNDYKLYRDY